MSSNRESNGTAPDNSNGTDGQTDVVGPEEGASGGSPETGLYSILCSSPPRNQSANVAMIAFIIPLPFALGIPHHSTFMIIGDDELQALEDITWHLTDEGPELPDIGSRIGVSIRVWRPSKSDVVIESLVRDTKRVLDTLTKRDNSEDIELPSEDTYGTVLEASTILYLQDEDKNESAAISRAFDRSIDSIGLLLRALRITLDDPRILPVGRMSLLPSIPFVVRYGDSLRDQHTGIFLVHMGESLPTFRTVEVSQENAAQVTERLRRAKNNFPTFAAEDAEARAKRSFYVESDYAATTVFAYSAIEIFCNGLLSLLYWERTEPRSDVVKILKSQGFESRMRARYSPILGGNWDFKSKASPIYVLDDVATIRHRYLHAGVEPSIEDAAKALEAYEVVIEFAKDRLVAKAFDFPRTTALILGEPGLRRKNAWTPRFQELLASVAAEADWIQSFHRWVREVSD